MKTLVSPVLAFLAITLSISCQSTMARSPSELQEVGIWELFEYSLRRQSPVDDPYTGTALQVELAKPDGSKVRTWGFYDGDTTWRVRFAPNQYGVWSYRIWFSDTPDEVIQGSLACVPSDTPGMVCLYEENPFWLGHKGSQYRLLRSFHVGDRFFADNWDDPDDPHDGNARERFLDWFTQNGYNMLSIASHYLNREEAGRGEGWSTPDLWPLNYREYRKMERILDELLARNIVVFPFGGFFGAKADWPTDPEEQELYVRYTLARIGHYPNVVLNVAGPEPFWRMQRSQYQWAMQLDDLRRLGRLIRRLDVHEHVLTVHNEKRASHYGDPFLFEDWYDMATLQGPTTVDREALFAGLAANHAPQKACYAQETLWYGNKNHPRYTDDDLRRNAYAILFAGAVLNFADMDGNSSSGFSGTMDFDQLHQDKHEIVKAVWDWFETIPHHTMRTRQELVRNGYCLAREGEEYYIYLDSENELKMHLGYPYAFKSEWINAIDPNDVRLGPQLSEDVQVWTPDRKGQWILHLWADH